MIKNYSKFSKSYSLLDIINEKDLVCSPDFLDRLKQIKKKNKIAKALYQLFDDENWYDDVAQNYIDIDKEDTVTFLSDKKADKLEAEGLDDDLYITKGRSPVKIGRFVNALFNNDDIKSDLEDYMDNKEVKPKDIEEFVNLYKSTSTDVKKEFKIVKGDDIKDWYDIKKYASDDKGTLGNSCMADKSGAHFNIYAKNSSCSLLIMVDSNNKLIGRALLWKLKESPCEAKYFLDRIYTRSDADVLRFKSYADEKGFLYKKSQSCGSTESLLFKYKENPVFGVISVKLEDWKCRKYPFIDTLPFLDYKNGILSNVAKPNTENIVLQSTDGDEEKCYECNNKGYVDCDDCEGNGESECGYCRGTSFKLCPDCKGIRGTKCDTCKSKGRITCDKCDDVSSCESCNGSGRKLCPDCTGVYNVVLDMINNGSSYKEYRGCVSGLKPMVYKK